MTFWRSGFFFFAVAVIGFGPLPRRQERHGQYFQISAQIGALPPGRYAVLPKLPSGTPQSRQIVVLGA
jgi:hypothetical protein